MNSVHALVNLKFQLCPVYELASLVEEPTRVLLGSNYSFNLIELKYCVNLETVEYTLVKFSKKKRFLLHSDCEKEIPYTKIRSNYCNLFDYY